ncbi:hypothetical protein K474DRAFT_621784, partial [Panus rudis PR-1116 ss-1]
MEPRVVVSSHGMNVVTFSLSGCESESKGKSVEWIRREVSDGLDRDCRADLGRDRSRSKETIAASIVKCSSTGNAHITEHNSVKLALQCRIVTLFKVHFPHSYSSRRLSNRDSENRTKELIIFSRHPSGSGRWERMWAYSSAGRAGGAIMETERDCC